MINLETLFKNHFDNKNIGDDKLKVFGEDHIGRLAVNNTSGMFTTILNDTITAHNNYFGQITTEATNLAIQKSLTMAVDNIIETFKDEVSRREGHIRNIFGKGSVTYIEFFPRGINEYRDATKANVETLINRIVNAANAHSAEVGSEFVNIFTAIQTNYISARASQLGKIGEVTSDKTGTASARNVLELQLTKNIHYIGFTYPGDVKRCMDFFDQSIIRPEQSKDTDGLGRAVGTTTDSINKQPLPNVEVEIIGADIPKARSKSDGKYRTYNVDVGGYKIRFSKPGYKSIELSIEIIDEGDTILDVSLEPE